MGSILNDFNAAVARHPERVAIVDGAGISTTFTELQNRAEGLARTWHRKGIRKGDRVLLAMGIGTDLYASLAALWSLGATVVLPEPAMGLKGLRHAARVTKPAAFCSAGAYGLLKFALPELWPMKHLRPHKSSGAAPGLPPPSETDIALISFTSGTTGMPKAIPRSHAFLSAQHRAIAPLLHSDKPERDLVTFPVFVLINIASGQTSVLPNWKMSRLGKLAPTQLEHWITSQNVTRALLPPSLCEKLAQTQIPATLHTVFTGGGPVFPDMLAALNTAKPSLKAVCVYGSTEAEPIAHLPAHDITADDHALMTSGKGLLVGTPVDVVNARVQQGEIQVAGAHVNSGYLDPAHDAENKIVEGKTIWHRTGDAGYFDAHNRLWLLGRVGSEVDTAIGPAFPFSIEVAARQWQGVAQCALVAVNSTATLAVAGDTAQRATWTNNAAKLGITSVKSVSHIPMDRRHASKVDRAALLKLL
ncbi:AMP-binding protein [Lentibacter algarum]|uniref:AMP-binding protein n=1 Tax=Lentibacter algarum TaxID=576131 RepID=UPI001C076F52|nr:AMP-binding protein [Lentibacter algarum]MBU2981677.1 AMP-binding protein [Lentibacter algarum]